MHCSTAYKQALSVGVCITNVSGDKSQLSGAQVGEEAEPAPGDGMRAAGGGADARR